MTTTGTETQAAQEIRDAYLWVYSLLDEEWGALTDAQAIGLSNVHANLARAYHLVTGVKIGEALGWDR